MTSPTSKLVKDALDEIENKRPDKGSVTALDKDELTELTEHLNERDLDPLTKQLLARSDIAAWCLARSKKLVGAFDPQAATGGP